MPASPPENSADDSPATGKPAFIYDGECPICSAYSAAVAGSEGSLNYRAIDARGSDPLVRDAIAAGLDLDEGMVVHHDGHFYHGAEALQFIAGRDRESGLWGMLNRRVFKWRSLSRLFYPLLRAGRNTLLRARGKPKIHS